MAKSDGTVYVNTSMDTTGFKTGLSSAEKQLNSFSRSLKKLGGVIAAAFAVKQVIQFGKEAIELGSDLQEVQNVVDTTFQTMNEQVNEFAQNAAETAGLSETMAKKYAGTFGAMAKAFGFAEGQAFDMSTSLTQLAGDVASFYNLTQDEAYTKLKSVFTGETESLKDLGVVMTQSALDSFAMAEGWGKTTKEMSEQEKVALRYAFVTKQLSSASGDFIKTQDSWANQTKILSLNFDSFKANIGQALINIFTPFLKVINQIVDKMAALSQHFVAFSEMLVGKSTSSGGGSPGETLGDISDGYGDITDSIEDATKAQKNYMSGLDEIRTFTSSEKNESLIPGGIGTTPSGGSSESSETKTVTKGLEKISKIIESIVEKVKILKDLFMSGFKIGFGDAEQRISSLREAFEKLKQHYLTVSTMDFSEGINTSAEKIMKALGEVAGSVASIGLTIATNLIGGIAGFLESEREDIQQSILSIFDITANIFEKAAEFTSAFAYVFEAFASEEGQQITEDILAIFSDAFYGATELALKFGEDIIGLIVDPFVNSKEELRKALEDLLGGVSDFTEEVRRVVEDAFSIINDIYDEHIRPIFDELIPEIEELWKEHISPLLSELGTFFSELGKDLGLLWDKTLKPIIQWIAKYILPVVGPVFESALKIIVGFFGAAGDVASGFLRILSGVISFIVGVFTLDWGRAWEGVTKIFSGIFKAIVAVVEFVINSIITLINGLTGGINFVTGLFGIPEIPEIPKVDIPMLATGAVIPPNAPFMAMLGDQKHGNNIEAPEDLIRKIVREESGNGNAGGDVTLPVYIDGTKLLEIVVSKAKLLQASTGQNILVEL